MPPGRGIDPAFIMSDYAEGVCVCYSINCFCIMRGSCKRLTVQEKEDVCIKTEERPRLLTRLSAVLGLTACCDTKCCARACAMPTRVLRIVGVWRSGVTERRTRNCFAVTMKAQWSQEGREGREGETEGGRQRGSLPEKSVMGKMDGRRKRRQGGSLMARRHSWLQTPKDRQTDRMRVRAYMRACENKNRGCESGVSSLQLTRAGRKVVFLSCLSRRAHTKTDGRTQTRRHGWLARR